MRNNTNAPEIPLCVNIIRLQHYLLQPDETMLFDWFIIKSIAFGYKEFHYSQARIETETRIKRSRQDKIIASFVDAGFLTAEVKEHAIVRGRVKHFDVDFSALSEQGVLEDIIRPDAGAFKHFLAFMKYHAAEQKKSIKKPTKKEVALPDNSAAVYKALNETYEARRKMYNDGKLTDEKPTRLKTETQLPRNKMINKKLDRLSAIYDISTIQLSFIAYTDAVFEGEEKPNNFMNLFLTYDDANGSWTVFEAYLNKHNLNYSYPAK